MITPSSLAIILQGAPFPGATFTVTPGGAALDLTLDGKTITFCEGAWFAAGRFTTTAHLSFAVTPTAERVHAEIRRVLAVINDSEDRRKDVEAQFAQVIRDHDAERVRWGDHVQQRDRQIRALEVERDRLLISEDTLSKIAAAIAIPALEPYDDALSMVRRLVDAHAVVSQRLIGSQKEVAERDATIDELRTALESIAAHVGLVGSDQWAVGDVVVKVGEVAARADKMTTQAKELRVSFAEFERRGQQIESDDELRSQLAVAVGLDGSASLALILDAVTRDRPAREIARLSGLLDVLAAPVTFGERRLSTAERAEWALRRAVRERDEVAPRMAQLIDAEVLLDVLGVPACAAVPGDDPGDASEALTVAERLRLYFAGRSS